MDNLQGWCNWTHHVRISVNANKHVLALNWLHAQLFKYKVQMAVNNCVYINIIINKYHVNNAHVYNNVMCVSVYECVFVCVWVKSSCMCFCPLYECLQAQAHWDSDITATQMVPEETRC